MLRSEMKSKGYVRKDGSISEHTHPTFVEIVVIHLKLIKIGKIIYSRFS